MSSTSTFPSTINITNYFLANGYANDATLSYESWIIWQSLNSKITDQPVDAANGYKREMREAISWAMTNNMAHLHDKLDRIRKQFDNHNSDKRINIYVEATKAYNDMKNTTIFQENVEIIKKNGAIIANLAALIETTPNNTKRAALETFKDVLTDLYKAPETINPMRPIASGVLDTSGADNIWVRMQMLNNQLECFSKPPVEYTSIQFRGIEHIIDTMCQNLIDNCKSMIKVDKYKVNIINPIYIPAAVCEQPVDETLKVHAAFMLLENLRQTWLEYPERSKAKTYNEGTYVADILSDLFKVFKQGRMILEKRWAEEASESSSNHKPDMRIKLPLNYTNKQRDLEILFLESSRPTAGVDKFIKDWIKLVRMGKRAHDKFFDEIHDAYERLSNFEEGRKLLNELLAIPIILIQVHCQDIKIAILDRPDNVYHRVCVLEKFTIPLTPLEDLVLLKEFVYYFLQLLEYVDYVSDQLQQIWNKANALDEKQFFNTNRNKKRNRSSTPPPNNDSMSGVTLTPGGQQLYGQGMGHRE